jgi:putative ABC transport system permease protein
MGLRGWTARASAALGLARLLKSLLYGVNPNDAATFVLGSLVLCGVALLARYIPARRATQIDPMVALSYE